MKKFILSVFLVVCFLSGFSQRIQKVIAYGREYERIVVDTLFALPADTFTVTTGYKDLPWVARIGTTIYLWDTDNELWVAAAGGGGSGTVTSVSRTNGYGITASVANPTTTPNITIGVDTATLFTALRATVPRTLQRVFDFEPGGSFLTKTDTIWLKGQLRIMGGDILGDGTANADSSLRVYDRVNGSYSQISGGIIKLSDGNGTFKAPAIRMYSNDVLKMGIGFDDFGSNYIDIRDGESLLIERNGSSIAQFLNDGRANLGIMVGSNLSPVKVWGTTADNVGNGTGDKFQTYGTGWFKDRVRFAGKVVVGDTTNGDNGRKVQVYGGVYIKADTLQMENNAAGYGTIMMNIQADEIVSHTTSTGAFTRWAFRNSLNNAAAASGMIFRNDINTSLYFGMASSTHSLNPDQAFINSTGAGGLALQVTGTNKRITFSSSTTPSTGWFARFWKDSTFMPLASGNGTKAVRYNPTTKELTYADTTTGGGGGITGLLTFGSSPNAEGLTISGSDLQMQPANLENPGGVSVTTQSFAGQKIFAPTSGFSNGTGDLNVNFPSNAPELVSDRDLYIKATSPNPVYIGTTASVGVTVTANQNMLLGTTSDPTATKVFVISNTTVAPSASATDAIILYADDVAASSELKVRDEASNVTVLSPHHFNRIPGGRSEEMSWSYYSERDGKYINVDMALAIRTIEQQSKEIEDLKVMVNELLGKKYDKKEPVKLIHTGKVSDPVINPDNK